MGKLSVPALLVNFLGIGTGNGTILDNVFKGEIVSRGDYSLIHSTFKRCGEVKVLWEFDSFLHTFCCSTQKETQTQSLSFLAPKKKDENLRLKKKKKKRKGW